MQPASNSTMSTATIHPTAIIGPDVKLGKNVVIGPYCVVQGPVELGDNVELKSHVVIEGITKIGAGTVVYSFAVLGAPTPDRKYSGEPSELIIGENNVIREYVTMHPGTAGDKMQTVIGNNNLILERVHIAHDCTLGNNITIVNSVGLSGHVTVEDNVLIGGMSGITQHVRIGTGAFIGGYCKVENDVLPYSLVRGDDGYLNGINIIGLRRRNFTEQETKGVVNAYNFLFSDNGTFNDRLERILEKYSDNKLVIQMVEFIRAREKGGLTKPRQSTTAADA